MEPIKKYSKTLSRVKWQWKSNLDPFSDTEEPQWTDYSPEQNYMLEKAYQSEKKKVDLGKYMVSVQHMVQSKKENRTLQRPIRRIVLEDDEVIFRSERYFETELPKTINKIFGNLGHFISFFSKRNSEILKLTELLQQIDESKDLDKLNTEILPPLILCLEKELLHPLDEQLKEASLSVFQKKLKQKIRGRHEELISLFKKHFASFGEFYGEILKSYTMATDLYLNLNKYLRNENWRAIDNLLLYAICLCKAFFTLKSDKNSQKEEEKKSITLYRGTALDEFTLKSYQTEKDLKFFSWNSVTSTTSNSKMAEKFMFDSVDLENKKYPVLFIIEIPIADQSKDSDYLKWIDIQKYSAKPDEDEVIIAPGSAFELEQISTDQEKRTTIKLKLKNEVESLAHGGLIMPGAFQSEMISDTQVKIMCLTGEELSEAFKTISGNCLVEEIEFCLCTFDRRSVKEMLETMSTLEKVKALKIISCKYEDEQRMSILQFKEIKNFNIEEVEISEPRDFFQIFNMSLEGEGCWKSLRRLNIDFRDPGTHRPQEANESVFQRLGHLTQLTFLTLSFSKYHQLTDEDITQLASQGLKSLTQLTSLKIDFLWCKRMMDRGISNLASQGLRYLVQLKSLTLDFSNCTGITDNGVNNLASQGLRYLTQLNSLSIDFSWDEVITIKGVNALAFQGLKYLIQLSSLALNFSNCKFLANEGVHYLGPEGLKNLAKLNFLNLDFSWCKQITNEELSNLAMHGLKNLTQLTSLTLLFPGCERITDDGVNALAFDGLNYLIQLTSLTLDFMGCKQITDKGLNNLESQGLKFLTQLKHFILNVKVIKQAQNLHKVNEKQNKDFQTFHMDLIRRKAHKELKILDEPPTSIGPSESISSQIPKPSLQFEGSKENLCKYFFGLVHLEWDSNMREDTVLYTVSSFCTTISQEEEEGVYKEDSGFNITPSEAFLQAYPLTSLTLNFWSGGKITDKGMEQLAVEGLKHLIQLTSLSLNFSWQNQITNEGVKNLASGGLRHLLQLTNLALNFSFCSEITGKGVSTLISEGLKHLTQFTSFSINFSWNEQTTDQEMNSLASEGLKYLIHLTSLDLDFFSCKHLTNEGVRCLASEGLKNLNNLTSLALNFTLCKEIEDEGLNSLACEGLMHLTHLTSLRLCFSGGNKITNVGMNALASKGLKDLTQLTSLYLSFESYSQITDRGLADLICQGLKNLLQLTDFGLNFSRCFLITDHGMKSLVSEGLKYLTQLTSLRLFFTDCGQITDEGVNNLIFHVIKYLIKLTDLRIDFSNTAIHSFTVSNIFRVLHYFGFMKDEKKRF